MLGPIVSAGANIIGGLFNRQASKDAAHNTRVAQQAQMQQQRAFAQNGIRWRVDDAKKAGIHPLYALGANTPTYTPTSSTFAADNSIGNSFAAAGQDIGRAINSTRTGMERVDAFTKSMQNLQLETAAVDLETKKAVLASQIARNRDNATPPSPGLLELDKWDKATPLMTAGNKINTNRGWSDGQTFEDRWGEWGGGLAGLAVMGADLLNTSGTWAEALQRKYPLNLSSRGSLREMSRELLGRR